MCPAWRANWSDGWWRNWWKCFLCICYCMCEASLTKSLVDAARKPSILPLQVATMPMSSAVPKLVDQFFEGWGQGNIYIQGKNYLNIWIWIQYSPKLFLQIKRASTHSNLISFNNSNPSLLADQATMKRLRELTGALLEMPHYLVPIRGCKNLGFPTKQVRVVHHDSTPPSRSDNPYSLEPTHNIIYIIYAVLSTAFIHKKKAHPTAKKQSLLPSFLYLSVDFLVAWLANISNSYGPLTKYIS